VSFEIPRQVANDISRFTGCKWLLPILLDWWDKSEERLFLLTGGPGTGKSTIFAWLAGLGPIPEDPTAQSQLARLRKTVKAVHFCQASSRNISPRAFAENIANQLTGNVKGFGDALVATLSDRVNVVGTVQAGTAAPGSSLTGVAIGRIDLGTLGDELSFDPYFWVLPTATLVVVAARTVFNTSRQAVRAFGNSGVSGNKRRVNSNAVSGSNRAIRARKSRR
jgi:energy-coupling factor transporter ATP-binding protein EcfA2